MTGCATLMTGLHTSAAVRYLVMGVEEQEGVEGAGNGTSGAWDSGRR